MIIFSCSHASHEKDQNFEVYKLYTNYYDKRKMEIDRNDFRITFVLCNQLCVLLIQYQYFMFKYHNYW